MVTLNSTVTALFLELSGRINLGEGALDNMTYEAARIFVVSPDFVLSSDKNNDIFARPILSIFAELGFDQTRPIREQQPNPLPDRKALDDIVFDALNLTQEERKEVYWSVAELVKNRLEKARSV